MGQPSSCKHTRQLAAMLQQQAPSTKHTRSSSTSTSSTRCMQDTAHPLLPWRLLLLLLSWLLSLLLPCLLLLLLLVGCPGCGCVRRRAPL
jgi:hypothetical protein